MSKFWYLLVLGALIGLGCARIAATYGHFWQTWDEPAHIAAGIQWWEQGRITHERLHPPVARIAMSAGPYFAGVRGTPGAPDHWTDGNSLLHQQGLYERNLTLARLGILPFFVIASLVVAAWTRRCAGEIPALVAVFLFGLLPPILAHGGLASLDMACAAFVVAALYALVVWTEKPVGSNAAMFGFFAALAATSKFSAIAFLAAGSAAVVLACFVACRGHTASSPALTPRGVLQSLVPAFGVFFLTVWAVYRFSFGTVTDGGAGAELDAVLASFGPLSPVARTAAQSLPLPALDFLWGLFDVVYFRRDEGHLATFFGEVGKDGWWLFYPVLLAVKTPLAFLLLAAVGGYAALKARVVTGAWPALAALFGAFAILCAGIFFTPHNGLRQILAVYPLLAVLAAFGATRLWRAVWRPGLSKAVVLALVASCAFSSFAAHPDYLPYFNVLARVEPGTIAADSDLDWGQDLKRLAETCRRRNIDQLHLRYNGSKGIDLSTFPLPEIVELKPDMRPDGWLAISRQSLLLGTGLPPYDQFSWLAKERPVEEVGSSILLYKLEP